MDWSICVVSDCKDGTSADLNNALLYGSKLIWIPPSCAPLYEIIDMEARYEDAQEQRALRSGSEEFLPNWTSSLKSLSDLVRRLAANEFDFNIEYWKMVSSFADVIKSVRIRHEELVAKFHPIQIQEISDYRTENRNLLERSIKDLKNFRLSVLQIVDEMANSAHAAMIFDSYFKPTTPAGWNTHHAAQELMNAMQRVLMPDVSDLSLEQVKALQDRAKDELEPMRAEMLKLTTDLRTMVGDDQNISHLTREAENLIATRVEPSVRELNSRIKSDLKQTALAHGGQFLKSIGLLGFGYLTKDADMRKDAVTGAIDHLSKMVPGLPTPRANTPASRFVIEIQQGIKKIA